MIREVESPFSAHIHTQVRNRTAGAEEPTKMHPRIAAGKDQSRSNGTSRVAASSTHPG